jgi:hypothetical protein
VRATIARVPDDEEQKDQCGTLDCQHEVASLHRIDGRPWPLKAKA